MKSFILLLLLLFLMQLSAFESFETNAESNKINVLEKSAYLVAKHTQKEASANRLTKLPQIIILSIFTGLFLSFLFYNIFLYLSTKETEYLLYTFYILSIYLFMLSLEESFFKLFDFNLTINSIFKTISFSASLLSLLFFTLKYFDVKKFNLKLYKITLWICAVILVLCFSSLYLGPFDQIIVLILMIVVNVLAFNIGYISYFNGYCPAKYYLLGIVSFLIGFFVSLGVMNNLLDYNIYTSSAMSVGSALEIVFFSLALGYKIKFLHKERNEALSKVQVQEKILFLQSRQASVGELVGNIAHQWREPLAEIGAIQTNLKATLLFKGAIGKEKLLNSVEHSYNIIRHLSDTIDVFYRFFRHKSSDKEEFDIIEEIKNIQKMVHYSLNVEKIHLICKCEQNISAFGEKSEFANALLNIILNAKDVLVERKITNPFIKINTYADEKATFITIEDNAGGIKQEPIEKIFDISISSKEESIGIGLFIAKSIIEQRMQGKLSVKNGENGAVFTIMLPLPTDVYNIGNDNALYDIEESAFEKICRLEKKVAKSVELEKALTQWEDIFNQTNWGVAVHQGVNNSFEMVNPAFCSMYGYSEKELKHKTLPELFTSQSLPLLVEKQKEAFMKGFVSFEAEHIRKDASTFPVNIDITVIKDESGEILYYIDNIRDISQQKKEREKLYLKKFAVDNIYDAIFLADKNGDFAYVNEAACSSLGYSKEELLSMGVGDVDPDWPKERWSEFWESLKKNKTALIEVVHKRRDGTLFPVEVKANYFEYEGVEYNLGLARDITERKAAQKELLLLSNALNNTNEATYIIMAERIVQVNNGACKMLGYSREELTSMTLYDIDKDLTQETLKELRNTTLKKNNRFERKHYTKDGRILDVEIDTSAFEYEGVTYAFSSVRDITEQKKAREELLLKEFALDKINEAVYLIDENSMFHYVNEGASQALGYTKEGLLTMGVIDIDPNFQLEDWQSHWESVKKVGATFLSTQHKRKDGTILPVEVHSNYIEYNGVGYRLATSRDITERLLLEAEKENRIIRTITENSPDIIVRFDTQCRRTYLNPKAAELFNVNESQLIGKTLADVTPVVDKDTFEKNLKSVIQTGVEVSFETAYIMASGKNIWLHMRMVPEFDSDGNISSVLSIGRDMTERKEMEEALKISEQKFRTLIENATDNIIRYDKEARITYMNPQLEKVLGISYKTVLGKTPTELITDGTYEQYEIELKKVIATGENTQVYITLPDTGNGKQYHYIQIVAERDIEGNIIGTIAFGRDVTELTNKTIELQKALEFNEGIIGAIPDLMFEVAPDGTYINVWAQNAELLAAQKEILLGKNFKEVLPPNAVITALQTLKEVDEKGFSLGNTYSLDLPDGKKWFELSVSKQKSSGNYIVLSRDITERKELEILLKKERKFLVDAQRVSHTGSWYLDIPNDVLSWSDETYRIFELEKENIDDLHKTFYECIHPDDREMVNVPYLESLKTGVPYEIEHRIVMSDGRIKHVIESCEHAYDSDGMPLYSIGTVQDITERKLMEQEIEDSYKFLNNLINSIPDPLFVKNREHRLILINDATIAMSGSTREELIGKSDYDIFPKEQADIFWKIDEEVFESKEVSINEEYNSPADGVMYCVQTVKSVFISEDGTEYLVGVVRDITERKKAEDAVQTLNETLEMKVEERTAELREREDKFKLVSAAIDSSTEAIYISDKEMSIIYVNEGACKMLGYTREELTSMKIHDIDALSNPDDLLILREELIETKETVFKTKHKAKDGRVIDVEIVGNPFIFNDTEVFVSVVKDIGAKKI